MTRSGARQFRVRCEHLADRPSEYAMHSKVSHNNVAYFPKEDRVADDVAVDDLEGWLDRADHVDGHIVVCNHCQRVKLLDNGIEVLHDGGDGR